MAVKSVGKIKSPFLENQSCPPAAMRQKDVSPDPIRKVTNATTSSVNPNSGDEWNKQGFNSSNSPETPNQTFVQIEIPSISSPIPQPSLKQPHLANSKNGKLLKLKNTDSAQRIENIINFAKVDECGNTFEMKKLNSGLDRPRLNVPPSPSEIRRQNMDSPNAKLKAKELDPFGIAGRKVVQFQMMSQKSSQFSVTSSGDEVEDKATDDFKRCMRKAKKRSIQRKFEKLLTSGWSGIPLGLIYGFLFFLIINMILEVEDNTQLDETQAKLNETSLYNIPSFTILEKYKLTIGAAFGAITAVTVALGGFLSLKLKTIFLLMVPALLANRGRSVLLSIGFGLLLRGPVGNIESNIQEGAESLVCMYEQMEELALNYTRQATTITDDIEELIQEFESTVNDMQKHMEKEISNATEEYRLMIEKVSNSLEKLEAIKRVGQKLDAKCDNVVGVVTLGIKDCSAPDWDQLDSIEEEIKEAMKKGLNDTINSIKNGVDIVDIDIPSLVGKLDGHNIEEIKESLKNILRVTFQLIWKAMTIFEKLLYFLIFLSINDARLYIKKYFLNDSFDNRLVDENIKRLWRRETVKMGRTMDKLTPLRNWEKRKKFRTTFDKKLSKLERKKLLVTVVPTLVFSLAVIAVIAFDFLQVKLMQLVKENGEYGIAYDGMTAGVGFSTAFGNFNKSSASSMNIRGFDLSTAECLPNVQQVEAIYLIKLGCTIVALFISSLLNAYTTRLNSKICNLFFKERAEERARYLYKTIQAGKYLIFTIFIETFDCFQSFQYTIESIE